MSLQQIIRQLETINRKVREIDRLLVKAPLHAGKNNPTTIAGGEISATRPHILLLPESGTADDLVTINNESDGKIIILRAGQVGDTITVKHNTGNIWLLASVDTVLDNMLKSVKLIYVAPINYWVEI